MAGSQKGSWKDIPNASVKPFVDSLRDVGTEGRDKIVKKDNQYSVVCIVSAEEISDPEQSFIKDVRSELRKKSEENTLITEGRFIKVCELAIVMNLRDSSCVYHHTEERILDPTGRLLRKIIGGNKRPLGQALGKDFIKELMDDFLLRHENKNDAEAIIVLFSLLIPCTLPGHTCAELIHKYADETGNKLIVSYDRTWKYTNTQRSLEILDDSPNICLVVRPEIIDNSPNICLVRPARSCRKIPLVGPDPVLDYDEFTFPTCQRIKRRMKQEYRRACDQSSPNAHRE